MDWLMKLLSMGQGGGGGGSALGPFGAMGAPQASAGPAANNGMPMNMAPPAPTPNAPLNLQLGNPSQSPGLLAALAQKFGGGQNPNAPNPNAANPNAQNAAMAQAMNLIKPQQLQAAPWMQMMPMGTMR